MLRCGPFDLSRSLTDANPETESFLYMPLDLTFEPADSTFRTRASAKKRGPKELHTWSFATHTVTHMELPPDSEHPFAPTVPWPGSVALKVSDTELVVGQFGCVSWLGKRHVETEVLCQGCARIPWDGFMTARISQKSKSNRVEVSLQMTMHPARATCSATLMNASTQSSWG